MTDLDLTEAVEAAAAAYFRDRFPEARGGWDAVHPVAKHACREAVLPCVAAAAPFIEAQVRAE